MTTPDSPPAFLLISNSQDRLDSIPIQRDGGVISFAGGAPKAVSECIVIERSGPVWRCRCYDDSGASVNGQHVVDATLQSGDLIQLGPGVAKFFCRDLPPPLEEAEVIDVAALKANLLAAQDQVASLQHRAVVQQAQLCELKRDLEETREELALAAQLLLLQRREAQRELQGKEELLRQAMSQVQRYRDALIAATKENEALLGERTAREHLAADVIRLRREADDLHRLLAQRVRERDECLRHLNDTIGDIERLHEVIYARDDLLERQRHDLRLLAQEIKREPLP